MAVQAQPGPPPTDPRIDPIWQARFDEAVRTDRYIGEGGRSAWVRDGRRDAWVRDFVQRVRHAAPKFGLPPTPTDLFVTAHAAIESGWGRSLLPRIVNNWFGIKGTDPKTWPGPVIRMLTTEYENGVPHKEWALWRVYQTPEEGVEAHLRIVTRPGSRYAPAAAKLRAGDPDYMAQLGRDGWYTDLPSKISSMWLDVKQRIERILATSSPPLVATTPRPPRISAASAAGIAIFLALSAGIGLWTALRAEQGRSPLWL